jgi:hypothetical protein
MWLSTWSLATAGIFLYTVAASPHNQNRASSTTGSVIELADGRTFTVPPGYSPTPAIPLPEYMVDNQHNYFHAAPDKYNRSLVNVKPPPKIPKTPLHDGSTHDGIHLGERRSGSSYWLANMGHGSVRAAIS